MKDLYSNYSKYVSNEELYTRTVIVVKLVYTLFTFMKYIIKRTYIAIFSRCIFTVLYTCFISFIANIDINFCNDTI